MRRDCILSKVRPKQKYFTFSVALAAIFLALSNTHSSDQQGDNSAAVAKWHGVLQQRDRSAGSTNSAMQPQGDANDSRSMNGSSSYAGRSAWKINITTTVFWVGEEATVNNPVPNDKSAWDGGWRSSYGDYDDSDPGAPVKFAPHKCLARQNPLYAPLPYNDVDEPPTKAEAS